MTDFGTAPDTNLNNVADTTFSETLPDLTEFADEPGGAWPKGWYRATVVEGYATRKGTVFETADNPSKDGASRNMRLCFAFTSPSGETRNLQESFNYRITDFDADRIAHIKEMRQEYKGVRGKWSDTDSQRTSLAIAKIGQLAKAFGISPKRRSDGALVPAVFVGHEVDVYLNVDDQGYNEIRQFAKAGERVRTPKGATK